MLKKKGMNDSDKVFTTVALWIAMISLFATALSLPMLPGKVTIFYKPEGMDVEYYSKYNNLLIVLTSVIPVAIIVIASQLRRYGKISHNFTSILLFSIILSAAFASANIYGIIQQFHSSSAIARVDTHALIALTVAFILSFVSACLPMFFHSKTFKASADRHNDATLDFCSTLEKFWYVGAFLFLLSAVASSFCTYLFAYISLAASTLGYIVFLIVKTKSLRKAKSVSEKE